MNKLRRLFVLVLIFTVGASPASAARRKAKSAPRTSGGDSVEAATRLQVFLDRANFGTGRLDGHCGDFTRKALVLYRQSRGEEVPAQPAGAKPKTAPDVAGLDLDSFGPAFITYPVTEADLQNVGPVPNTVAEKAKLKALPYRDAGEALAEKFHCERKFLDQLNPGKTKTIRAGDQLKVPNVEPFELAAVKDLKPGSEIAAATATANELPDEPETAAPGDDQPAPIESDPGRKVNVDTKLNFLTVLEGNKLVAAFPVTIGSAQTVSPVGEWKVRGVAKLPTFRYDEQMLNHGQRSKDFHMLPPGPNNPVGVVWIALNKKGIGLHGTEEPDTIGRSASHGCVRLANWDIVRLAAWIKGGVPVSIY